MAQKRFVEPRMNERIRDPEIRLIGVEGDVVSVKGLDAINGTPVLDIKPYFPQYDYVDNAKVPDWVGRLMEGYF